ncbi:MAG: ABC transporter permease [Cytophagales bacterium]|nr:ABC transporter permease [Cytophagales bacterium]
MKKQEKIPTLVKWLFSKSIDQFMIEELLGDLQEMREDRTEERGKFIAGFMYWVDAFHLLTGFSTIRISKTQNRSTLMFQSLFKIAWRNALRQKQFTVLNVLGLTLGIATTLFIGLYIDDELSYDTFHEKGDRIYRVNQPNIWGDWDERASNTGPNVATALKTDIPEFEEVTRLLFLGHKTVKGVYHDRVFKESRIYAADENFFDVFTFPLLSGNPNTAFARPNTMVLTQETVARYFGDQMGPDEVVGKTISMKDYLGKWIDYEVVGVADEIPSRSHIQFDALISLKSEHELMESSGWKWIFTAFSTYVLVNEHVDLVALTEKIQELPAKWAPPTTEKIFNQTFEEFTKGYPWKLGLQPMREIYIAAHPQYQMFGPVGNPEIVQIFAAIGLLVLILSVINFMNLSTARSTTRSKEVGVRKVLGSARQTLIYQFVLESVIYVCVSTMLALALVYLSLDAFNVLAEKELELTPYLITPLTYLVMLGFVLMVGILAGSYPSFYLSSFRPIETLKNKLGSGRKGKVIRNGLVVLQFTISITLIICTFFVQKQLDYSSKLDVGFAKDNVLQLHNIEQFGFDTDHLKARLEANPAFLKVGKSFGLPPQIYSGDRYKSKSSDEVIQMNNVRAGKDFLDLLGLTFLEGRNFNSAIATDKYKVVLNEKAVAMLGWGSREQYSADSPIGKIVKLASGDEDEFEVIGVVKDFNFSDLKQEIAPLVIINHLNDKVWDFGAGRSYLSLKLDPNTIEKKSDLDQMLLDLEEELRSIDASVPFEYTFMDQTFDQAFRSEQRMATVLNVFTLMAMMIACIGLFGLAAFSAEQRTKELGIRKVLGAAVFNLVKTFSTEFTRLVFIAILLATPVAYLTVRWWLTDFAYRTPIDWWVFAMAISGALLLAIGTISFQSFKVAHQNPAEALKDE